MSVVYLILGTNLGDRIKNLRKATELINKSIGKIIVLSSVYETEPWGFNHKSNFLNQVLKINTSLRPEEILEEIIKIEKLSGRKRSNNKYEARVIDIDILFYDNKVIKSDRLIIPHPKIQERMFVLVPMAELQQDFIHPELQRSIGQLKNDCRDTKWVREYRIKG
jgi:2-amino-4-hydroxy-6-hydroxymethyldihydropteridine diphosphokinase